MTTFKSKKIIWKNIASAVLCVTILSCVDEPTLSVVPQIKFNRIEFTESGTPSSPDLLIVHLDFKDGDGDLGLLADQTDAPYNQATYFYDTNGKLLTLRSRSLPQYANLPPYENPYDCNNYTDPNQTLYFPADAVDNTFNIVDTVIRNGITYYGVKDLIYFENNPNHFNIRVDFLVRDASGTFTEFNWREEFCNQTFDGRFPPMRDEGGTLEGTLSYTMNSIGFKNLFSVREIKLRITIKDRQLHESNTIETPPFTLDSI